MKEFLKNKFSRKHILLLLLICVLAVSAAVGTTLSYISTGSNTVTNTFEPAQMSCKVLEEFNSTTIDNVKKDVRVLNTSDGPAYIRVKLLPYWYAKDSNPATTNDNVIIGKNAWTIPDNAFASDTNWVKGSDGYYYYTKPVPAGEETGVLIGSLTLGWDEVTFARQVLEIIASCVQAEPSQAVKDAWSADVSGGILTPPTGNS